MNVCSDAWVRKWSWFGHHSYYPLALCFANLGHMLLYVQCWIEFFSLKLRLPQLPRQNIVLSWIVNKFFSHLRCWVNQRWNFLSNSGIGNILLTLFRMTFDQNLEQRNFEHSLVIMQANLWNSEAKIPFLALKCHIEFSIAIQIKPKLKFSLYFIHQMQTISKYVGMISRTFNSDRAHYRLNQTTIETTLRKQLSRSLAQVESKVKFLWDLGRTSVGWSQSNFQAYLTSRLQWNNKPCPLQTKVEIKIAAVDLQSHLDKCICS